MKHIYQSILILVIFTNTLYSCELCNVSTPVIHPNIAKKIQSNNTNFTIEWVFNEPFTKQAIESYPVQFNINFKLQEIKNSLEVYINKNNYLTHISLNNSKDYRIKKLNFSKLKLKNNMFIYTYSFNLPLDQIENENISIEFKDKGNFFIFISEDEDVTNTIKPSKNKFIESLSKILSDITIKIKNLLNQINQSNSYIAYAWLFLFSFGYGVLHAVGPGHGKSLVSSYFLGNNSSHFKAFIISSLIGVVHTFSAFILTFVIYYSVNTFFGSYFNNIEIITTKLSAIIIISIALYLLYKKYTKTKSSLSCGCSVTNTKSLDFGVIIAAGIVPCAGTVMIFIYTMTLGEYFIGFLSAIFMSLGMSVVIFITALLSIKIRKKSSSNTKMIKILEYGSLLFILSLGILLLVV